MSTSDDALIAAIPVSESQQRLVSTLARLLGVNAPHRYADSVEGTCVQCGQAIWLGPKQQGMLKLHPDIPTVCFMCVLGAMKTGYEPQEIRSLGNREFG